MPLTGNVSQNIDELTHHGSRPRSHAQIVAIALHAAHTDDHGHKGSHTHDHVTVHNAHPHAAPSHPHVQKQDVDINPNKKSYNTTTHQVIGEVPHGAYKHLVHDRRDKGPEHHPPSGLMNQTPANADNSGNT